MFEEWAVPVDFLCVLIWVPIKRPPAFLAVDGVRCVFLVDGYYGFFAGLAGVVVQGAFIAPSESALESAVWAEGGVWGFHLCVKFLVLGGDFE